MPLHDLNGSTIAHVDSTGSVANSYTYDPNGTPTVSGASVPDPYEFAGMEMDADGLYYAITRYYSPRLVRPISEIGPAGASGGGSAPGQPPSPAGSESSVGSHALNGAIGLGAGDAAGVGTAAGLALASPKAFGDAFWLAIAPEAGVGPAGWVAIGVTIVAEIILEIFDPFGSSTPELTRKEWHRQHSEQADKIGTPIPDQKPSVRLPCDGLPLQRDAGNFPGINAPFIGFHYCGSGGYGGEPTNPTDACCQAHDCAYGAAGLSGANVNKLHPGVGAGAAQRKADAALCDCVRGVPAEVGQTYLRQIQAGIGRFFCYQQ